MSITNVRPYSKYGELIHSIRREKDLTQEGLAEKAGLDPKTIIEIEGGKRRNPTLKTLQRIANALGISINKLLKNS